MHSPEWHANWKRPHAAAGGRWVVDVLLVVEVIAEKATGGGGGRTMGEELMQHSLLVGS